MSFSFDPTLADSVSQVRIKVGDVQEVDHLIEDETITVFIAQSSSVLNACIPTIEAMIAMLSVQGADWESGDEKEKTSQKLKALRDLKDDINSIIASQDLANFWYVWPEFETESDSENMEIV
jgi:hypothetical protein